MKKTITFSNIEIKKEKESRTFTATITSSCLDRDKEVLIAEGMTYKEFMSNPVVFFNHNYDTPIGKVLKLHKYSNQWKAKVKIADEPDNYNGSFFPSYVWSLIEQGIVKGVSIGFEVVANRLPTKKDLLDYGREVRSVITRFNLLELSIAPLQANQEALISAVGKNMISTEQVKKYFDVEVSLPTERQISVSLTRKEATEKRIKKEINIQLRKRNGELYR